MADEKRANGRRYGRRRRGRGDRSGAVPAGNLEEASEVNHGGPAAECPICHNPIYDLSSALSDTESGEPIHFDCALRRVGEHEALAPGEKIVYIGSGVFAVIEFKDKSETAFVVKRRIPFEEEGKKQEWRKVLSSRVSNL